MNNVVLRPITEKEYDYWKELSVEDYANELIDVGKFTEERAMAKAKSEFDKMLVDGIRTPNNYIYIAENNSHENVGLIWYNAEKKDKIFIAYFIVYQEHRGMGYSKAILLELEKLVKNQGINLICLHVFKNNYIAINLYNNMGYEYYNSNAGKGSAYMRKYIM